jgi:oxepin-CoA hydrolase/3-oxo-5,6-dehydrosuberyl-CoA semialdehyde dehydrogenase
MTTVPFDVNDPELRTAFLRDHLGQAITALREDSQARWGKMTAQQMVEHLAWAFEVSTGHAHVDCAVPTDKQERWKAFLFDNTPMRREFMNPALTAGLPALRHASLDEAKAALSQAVEQFVEQCRASPSATHTHPVFGPMETEEWERSHFKHAYHHLLQFALLDHGGGDAKVRGRG